MCEPIYEELDGWDEDITMVREYDKLPKNARAYIEKIEQLCNINVSIIGVGPGREQVIYK